MVVALMLSEEDKVKVIEVSDAPTLDAAVMPVAPVTETLPEVVPAAGTVKTAAFSPAVVPISTIVFVA
jgi:hypothetical protein